MRSPSARDAKYRAFSASPSTSSASLNPMPRNRVIDSIGRKNAIPPSAEHVHPSFFDFLSDTRGRIIGRTHKRSFYEDARSRSRRPNARFVHRIRPDKRIEGVGGWHMEARRREKQLRLRSSSEGHHPGHSERHARIGFMAR